GRTVVEDLDGVDAAPGWAAPGRQYGRGSLVRLSRGTPAGHGQGLAAHRPGSRAGKLHRGRIRARIAPRRGSLDGGIHRAGPAVRLFLGDPTSLLAALGVALGSARGG